MNAKHKKQDPFAELEALEKEMAELLGRDHNLGGVAAYLREIGIEDAGKLFAQVFPEWDITLSPAGLEDVD